MILSTNLMKDRLDELDMLNRNLSHQMSTKRKIDNGSENTDIYSKTIHFEEKVLMYEEIEMQIKKANAQNTTADSAIGSIKKTFDNILARLISANTSTNNDAGRKIIATELKGMRENLFDFVNTRTEDEYVFAGNDTKKKAFVKQADGSIKYNGNNEVRKVLVDEGSYRERGITGIDLMYHPVSTAIKNQSLEFREDHRITDENGEEWKLNAAKTQIVRYDYKGEATPDTKAVTQVLPATTPATYTVNVGTADGTKFEARQNIFDLIDASINALDKVDKNGNPITSQEARDIIGKMQDAIRESKDTVDAAHSKLGGRNKIFELSEVTATTKKNQYSSFVVDTAGIDYGKVAMETKALQLTYSAVYSTINRTSQLSLANFIK